MDEKTVSSYSEYGTYYGRFFSMIVHAVDNMALENTEISGSEEPRCWVDEEGFFHYEFNEEFWNSYYSLSEEELAADTYTLLCKVLESRFMQQQVYSCSNGPDEIDGHYELFNGFMELVSRKDLLEAMNEYAKKIVDGTMIESSSSVLAFYKLLKQGTMDLLIGAGTEMNNELMYLRNMVEYETEPLSDIEDMTPVFTLGDVGTDPDAIGISIDYYDGRVIRTLDGESVNLYWAGKQLSDFQKESLNLRYDHVGNGNTRIAGPSSYYNCHSFAWYKYSTGNLYWMEAVEKFIGDSHTSRRYLMTEVEELDIIVYYSGGKPVHSGIVYSVNGEKVICSKWGMAGVYLHGVTEVPEGYTDYDGEVTVRYYSYHKYTNNVCDICGKQK